MKLSVFEMNLNEFVMILFDFALDWDEFDINLFELYMYVDSQKQPKEGRGHKKSSTKQATLGKIPSIVIPSNLKFKICSKTYRTTFKLENNPGKTMSWN